MKNKNLVKNSLSKINQIFLTKSHKCCSSIISPLTDPNVLPGIKGEKNMYGGIPHCGKEGINAVHGSPEKSSLAFCVFFYNLKFLRTYTLYLKEFIKTSYPPLPLP